MLVAALRQALLRGTRQSIAVSLDIYPPVRLSAHLYDHRSSLTAAVERSSAPHSRETLTTAMSRPVPAEPAHRPTRPLVEH